MTLICKHCGETFSRRRAGVGYCGLSCATTARNVRRYASQPSRRLQPEYWSWRSMRQRCTDPSASGYRYYGGRGITVCGRWRESFDAFLADMGPRPSPKHSIDRVNNNGNYEPGNCRWATAHEQHLNTSRKVIPALRGESLSVAEWAARIGISPSAIHRRLKLGQSVEQALSPRVTKSGKGVIS